MSSFARPDSISRALSRAVTPVASASQRSSGQAHGLLTWKGIERAFRALDTPAASARTGVVCTCQRGLDLWPGHIRRDNMTLGTILLIVVILLLIGALPSWPYSREWGYRPTGLVGIVLIVVIVLLLMGQL
jgi:hypothetical protein